MARTKNDNENEVVTMEVPVKKVFKDTDRIPCMSVTVGHLYVEGDRSKELYTWEYAGDVIEVEYRDLISLIRKHDVSVYQPRFIIQDEDFLKEHGDIELMYGNLYSPEDYRKILNLAPNDMRNAINKMPEGAKECLKNFAIQAIGNGTLDSIQRVKVIDEIFNTKLLMRLSTN